MRLQGNQHPFALCNNQPHHFLFGILLQPLNVSRNPFLLFTILISLIAANSPVVNNKMASYVVAAARLVAQNPGTTLAAGVGGAGLLAVAAPAAIMLPMLSAAGFSAGGVGAGRYPDIISRASMFPEFWSSERTRTDSDFNIGTVAAGVQGMIGNVVAGSIFAACQSAAAGGAGAATVAGVTQAAGGLTAAAAGIAKFFL